MNMVKRPWTDVVNIGGFLAFLELVWARIWWGGGRGGVEKPPPLLETNPALSRMLAVCKVRTSKLVKDKRMSKRIHQSSIIWINNCVIVSSASAMASHITCTSIIIIYSSAYTLYVPQDRIMVGAHHQASILLIHQVAS